MYRAGDSVDKSVPLAESRGPPLLQKAYEISKSSNLPKDFKISGKISDFRKDFERFQISGKISKISGISVEISGISGISAGFQGFQQRFKDFNDRFEDFMPFLESYYIRRRPRGQATDRVT